MNREELQSKIFNIIDEDYTLPFAATEKIMLIFDEYIDAREKEKLPSEREGWLMELDSLVMSSESLLHKLERKGWKRQQIQEEIEPFADSKYRDRKENVLSVMNHFFNSLNLRKPNDTKRSRYDKFASGHQSQFGAEDGSTENEV